jgi:hypothetical protein
MALLSAALTSGGLQQLVGAAYQLFTREARDGSVAYPGLEDRDQLTHCRLKGRVRARRIGLDGPLLGSSRVPRSGSWRARTGARRHQHAEGDETRYRCYRDETGPAVDRSPVLPPARGRAHHIAHERGCPSSGCSRLKSNYPFRLKSNYPLAGFLKQPVHRKIR